MTKLALFARFEAQPGKEAAVAQFLEKGLAMANEEAGTKMWFALQLSDREFGVFDTFDTEEARQAHLNGPIAQALMAQGPSLFTGSPSIQPIRVLGLKK